MCFCLFHFQGGFTPFESIDEIPNCDHLNKRFRAVLSCGFLRSEDSDGRGNVAEKVNSRSLNLHPDYSKSLTLGEPYQSWIPKNHSQVQIERGNFVVACVYPLYNVKLGIFTS